MITNAHKKSDLYASIWKSCDELRGGMDASQYKDYVLTMLFLKYVSDKYAGDPNALLVIPEGSSFDDLVELKGNWLFRSYGASHFGAYSATFHKRC